MPRKNRSERKGGSAKGGHASQKGGHGSAKNKRSIKSSLLNFLKKNPDAAFNYRDVAANLGLHSHAERDTLLSTIEELINDGYLEAVENGSYKPMMNSQYVQGKVDMTKSGGAYIIVEGLEEDIYVPPGRTGQAFDGDIVKVMLYARRSSGKKQEGEVVEVIERKKNQFTGVLRVHDKFAFLVSDSRKFSIDIFIPISKLGEGKDGMKAVAKIIDWPKDAKSPIGKIVRVLGIPGEHNTEMHAIMAEYELPDDFDNEVEEAAARIPEEITEEEVEKRWDFRGVPTFTIDPVDAKDFDDALSFRFLPKGQYEVGIHIADVAHYVREGSILDREALNRATSVYLVDRVIPMLPERLSNGLCSLRPDEDKLTFSVVVVLDEEGNVKREWFGRTVIRSQKRFAYEEAQEVLETGEGPYAKELLALNRLAYKLREKKFSEGAISFETEEVKFKLDENGKPLYVYKKERKDAHKLIEDFMLLANRKVAEFIFKRNAERSDKPFVYRVHDNPDPDRVAAFARVAAQFGHKVNTMNSRAIAKSLNKVLENVEGRPEQNMLQTLAIRTMPKAFYTTKKASHYGLAFDYYTHFTSPIRRYPDVIAHRLLACYLENKTSIDQEEIEAQAKHSSDMEVRAAEAERASIKYKQVEYIKDHIGDEFDGVISGVTEWGIYVEMLENKCEGMVRLAQMRDDHYIFEEERYLIRGHNTGKVYQLGNIVRVVVTDANLNNRTIDLEFVDTDGDAFHGEMDDYTGDENRGPSRNSKRRKNKREKAKAAAQAALDSIPDFNSPIPEQQPEPKSKKKGKNNPAESEPDPSRVEEINVAKSQGRGSHKKSETTVQAASEETPAEVKPKGRGRGKSAVEAAESATPPATENASKTRSKRKTESATAAPEAEADSPAKPARSRGKKSTDAPAPEPAPETKPKGGRRKKSDSSE